MHRDQWAASHPVEAFDFIHATKWTIYRLCVRVCQREFTESCAE